MTGNRFGLEMMSVEGSTFSHSRQENHQENPTFKLESLALEPTITSPVNPPNSSTHRIKLEPTFASTTEISKADASSSDTLLPTPDSSPVENTPHTRQESCTSQNSSQGTLSQDNIPNILQSGKAPQINDASQDIMRSMLEACTCSICLGIMALPYSISPCGHSFCRKCIWTWISSNEYDTDEEEAPSYRRKCPSCRQLFEDIAPNVSLKQIIASFLQPSRVSHLYDSNLLQSHDRDDWEAACAVAEKEHEAQEEWKELMSGLYTEDKDLMDYAIRRRWKRRIRWYRLEIKGEDLETDDSDSDEHYSYDDETEEEETDSDEYETVEEDEESGHEGSFYEGAPSDAEQSVEHDYAESEQEGYATHTDPESYYESESSHSDNEEIHVDVFPDDAESLPDQEYDSDAPIFDLANADEESIGDIDEPWP